MSAVNDSIYRLQTHTASWERHTGSDRLVCSVAYDSAGLGIGIAHHAPNPYAAAPFNEYMLWAPRSQKTLGSLGYLPTSSGLSSRVPNLTIKLVDPVVMLNQVEKWNMSVQEIFVKRSGQ